MHQTEESSAYFFLSVTQKRPDLRSSFLSCYGEILVMVSSYAKKSALQELWPCSGVLSSTQDETQGFSLGRDLLC